MIDCLLLGKWRITEMELWGRDFLDLVEPAYLSFDKQGGGEFVFGCVYGSLDSAYARESIHFTWYGSDEKDEVHGDGYAELEDDGSLEGEINYHNGDKSTFKAERWPFSTSC